MSAIFIMFVFPFIFLKPLLFHGSLRASLPILQISCWCVKARLGFSEPSNPASAHRSASSTRVTAHFQTSSVFYKP